MKTLDFAYVILTYNFLVGALLLIAGENLGVLTARVLECEETKRGATHSCSLRDLRNVSRHHQFSCPDHKFFRELIRAL